jgi:hypothetical protein
VLSSYVYAVYGRRRGKQREGISSKHDELAGGLSENFKPRIELEDFERRECVDE